MAINGDGWFVVAQPTGFTDNQPIFSGVTDFTRAGNFQLNDNGNLVNAAGYYLMGIPVNATTGNPEGSVPQVLQFNNNFIPAQETTAITYQANLPSAPSSGAVNPERFCQQSDRWIGNYRHRRHAVARCRGDRDRYGRQSDRRNHADVARDYRRRHRFDRRWHQHDGLYGHRYQHRGRSDQRHQLRRRRQRRGDRRAQPAAISC